MTTAARKHNRLRTTEVAASHAAALLGSTMKLSVLLPLCALLTLSQQVRPLIRNFSEICVLIKAVFLCSRLHLNVSVSW